MTIHGRPAGLWLQVSLLVIVLSAQSFAVDRSKFRTCQQTSFCRRHREKASAILYKYALDRDSIHFHLPSAEEDDKEKEEKDNIPEGEDNKKKDSLWSSLTSRILGSSSDGDGALDPYIKGPSPILTALIHNQAPETSTRGKETLQWSVFPLQDGLLRMRITEVYGTSGAPFEKARVTYDELILIEKDLIPAHHALLIRGDSVADAPDNKNAMLLKRIVPNGNDLGNYIALEYGDSKEEESNFLLLVQLDPFSVSLYRQDSLETGPVMTMNADQMMHFEIRRIKGQEGQQQENEEKQDEKEEEKKTEEKEIVGYWEDGLAIYADGTREEKKVENEEEHRKLSESELDREGMWEEKFQSHQDSKPHGPMSVGMDITFPNSKHIFGIPEHASSTELKSTLGDQSYYTDPFRLYNLDVFEYELDETMALYGHVPLIISHSKETGTCGFFWFNPTETFVDVLDENGGKTTHWMSESGIVDVFMMPGPSPKDIYRQYAKLTGTVALPPMFSLGYHQCRWNYKDEKDVYQVHEKFEELDYPYDVLWLDIEHTDGKRYFTWDSKLFPNPEEMQEKLWSQGRRMVTIIDPHIKRDDNYWIHKEATNKGLYIKDKTGSKDYDGWCWPGSSSYLDFTSDKVRSWWADQFAYNKYKGSTPTLFTWNDMNEPSVFNGPEVSMQKDLKNLAGHEHREWHNLYGLLFHRSTAGGQIRRNPTKDVRPFVLTRAFFAGTQRYGAIWTGDNTAEWGHLEISTPMLLSLNVAALSFVGADVGGFFGNPDAELMTRWMQAGAYQPFFRGHAHHDSKRREPWLFGQDTLVRLRRAAMARYALLPMWYTVFYEASKTGMPVMRTMWMQYPDTQELFGMDKQYLIGSDLLVHPVTGRGETTAVLEFPTKDIWYDVDTSKVVSKAGAPDGVNKVTVLSDLDKIPVYQRGGSIILRKLRLRRSTQMMKTDPYTLYIALNEGMGASGSLYMDDEESFGHDSRAEFALARFEMKGGKTIECKVEIGGGWQSKSEAMESDRVIERIVIMGLETPPARVSTGDLSSILFEHDAASKVLVLRKPGVSALADWQIILHDG